MRILKYIGLFSLVILTACSANKTKEPLSSAVFIDGSLNSTVENKITGSEINYKKLSIEKHGSKETPTGTMEAWAVIRNHTDYDQEIQVNAVFYDDDQVASKFEATPQRVFIKKNSSATFRQSSVEQDMKFYNIEINGAK